MSWDVMVFDFGDNPKPMSEMTEGDQPLPLGTPAEVRAKNSAIWRILIGRIPLGASTWATVFPLNSA